MFADSFGRVSHNIVCKAHDREYWYRRTLLNKLMADWRWFYRLNAVHWVGRRRAPRNTIPWAIFVFIISVPALLAVLLVGGYMFSRRHEFDETPDA